MLKITLLVISLILSYGFNSNKIETNIISSSKIKATIDKKIPNGMTGFIIHNNMVIGKAISNGNYNVNYLSFLKLKNDALATPNITPKKGDTIIFGIYNKRWLLIAPNQESYLKTIKNNPNISFISSDIFATYFDTKPTQKDFIKFCKDFNIGIINFVLDKNYIVDANSFIILDKTNLKKEINYKKPFYTNYKKFKKSLFSFKPKIWINYYNNMLKNKVKI